MLFLLLSIVCSVLLGFIFKLYGRYGVDSFQAIVFNYVTCVCCGWIYSGSLPLGPADGDEGKWLPYALGLGIVFITGFTGAALTVKHFGVTVSQIMQKMSILVTVPFAILVYHESASVWKITGVAMALAAIILVNWPKQSNTGATSSANKNLIWLPIITWALAGVIEITFLWVQGEKYVAPDNVRFISTVFGTAGVLGLSVAAFNWIRGTMVFSIKNVWGGIILGIPNFGSMYFLLRALGTGLEGSVVFPVINVGIILVTTIGAVALFRERLSTMNWIGFLLALLAIILMAL
jgi:drug/metabolite transporter (DMT)-like permease